MVFRKYYIFVLVAIIGAITAKPAYLNNKALFQEAFQSESYNQSANLRIVGPNQDPNPVVNESGRIQLDVIDASGKPVSGAVFQSGSPEIASVDPNTGIVSGAARGYATITAKRGNDSFSAFVVVARLSSAAGNKIQGDTKVDTGGAVYISDPINNVILKKNGPAAEPALFAGRRGMRGVSDGPRLQALFAGPTAVAVDNRAQGGVYIADTLNHGIRKIDFNNQVSRVLGTGAPGINRNDITPFDQAAFSSPRGVAADSGGNLYIADTDNNAIYLADFSKREVRLIAGQPGESGKADGKGRASRFNRPTAITVQSPKSKFFGTGDQGGIYVADAGNNRVRFISFDGSVTTLGRIPSTGKAASSIKSSINPNQSADEFEFVEPQSVSVDGIGNVYVIDRLGAKLVTQPAGQMRQVVSLAQADSFQQAASVVVQGNQTFVLDAGTATPEDSLKVVTVGEPEIERFTVSPSRVFPNVPLEGGVEVSITGRNFAPEAQVTLGDGPAAAKVMSATEIRVLIPPQKAPGNRTLSIQTRGGVAQTEVTVESKPLSDLSEGQITTIAGGVPVLGNGGKAVNASLNQPRSITVDGAGNLFIGDLINRRVRRVDAGSGIIISVAGNGTEDFTPNGPATSSGLRTPAGVAVDESGNLFISDSSLRRILRVDNRTGILSIFAGNGNSAASGDGGPAGAAGIAPQGITPDRSGNLLIADTGNARIRRVDGATGIITTIAGNGIMDDGGDGGLAVDASFRTPIAVAVDPSGNIFIGDTGNRNIRRIDAVSGTISTIAGNGESTFNGDNIPATSAALEPAQLSIDGAGNIFVVDNANNRVRRIDVATGIITTTAGNGDPKFSGDGGPAVNAGINPTGGVSVDGLGNVFIGDFTNNRVRRIDAKTGIIATVAGNGAEGFGGDGGKSAAASLDQPEGAAFDSAGNLYIADTGNNRIRRVDAATGVITTIAGNGTKGFDGDGGLAVDAALNGPRGTAIDKAGNLLIADTENNRIRQLNLAAGTIVTIAGGGNPPDRLGDGGPAANAALGNVVDIVVDRAGNIFFSDTGNQRIRRIDAAAGIITTIAGTGNFGFNGDGIPANMADLALPQGLAVDEAGNLFIADTGNGRVRRVDAAAGIISTIADGGDAGLVPRGVAIDAKGNLLISDISKGIIRKADMRTGSIVTIAGAGVPDFGGDGGPALGAGLNFPTDLAVDKAGNLFIADTRNNAVRAVKGTSESSQRVAIDGASYAKRNLLIAGSGFGSTGAKVFVNDLEVSSLIAGQNPNAITLKGSKKKLNLKSGANRISVTVGGAASNVFVLNLFDEADAALHIILPLADDPSITNFSPSTASPGTRITINGNNFNNDIIAVLFNNAAGVGVDKGTAVLCSAIVPANATTGRITVIRGDGKRATSSGTFNVIGGGGGSPTIASFFPTSGPISAVVSITGSNFKDVTEVRFGNAAATFTVNAASTLINAVVPAGATGGQITLRSAGGTATSPISFTVTNDGPFVEEETKIDDGTFENGAVGDGIIIVNRLTPSSYPSTLQKISIGSFQFQNLPSPVGQTIRLVAFVDPSGNGTPPSNPAFIVDQSVVIPRADGFVEFVVNGPQIDRGDVYVGYQAPNPRGGVVFAADTNGTQRQRGFFSATNGQTFQGPLTLANAPVNILIRAVFVKPQAQPDFTLSANPSSQSITAGQSAVFNIGVQGLNGFAQSVNLNAAPPNANISANLSISNITPGNSAVLNVTADANTPAGTYALTVIGRSGQIVKTATVVLNVAAAQPQPDFVLNANPASRSIAAGQSANFNISAQGLNGFAQSVNLSVNSPNGITAGLSSNSITPGNSAALNATVSANTPAGTFNLIVTGRSGQITKTVTVVLNVTAAQPDFTLNADPASRSIAAGQSASFNLSVQGLNGFAQSVALSATASDPAISVSLSSSSVSPGSAASLNAAVSANASAGTYSIVITGTSGQIVKSAAVTLIVTAPSVEIRSVSFNKPILLIGGSGFGSGEASVNINGAVVSSRILNRVDTAITLRGNKKKLNLIKGSNRITVTIGGIASNTFTFTVN